MLPGVPHRHGIRLARLIGSDAALVKPGNQSLCAIFTAFRCQLIMQLRLIIK